MQCCRKHDFLDAKKIIMRERLKVRLYYLYYEGSHCIQTTWLLQQKKIKQQKTTVCLNFIRNMPLLALQCNIHPSVI